MTVSELKQQIIQDKLNHLYIFTGEEVAVRDIYIKQIIKTSNAAVYHTDSAKDAINALTSKSLFTSGKRMFVVHDDKEFITAFDKNIDLENRLKDNILILLYQSIDKRSKFYKAYADEIVTFDKLSTDMLVKYIQQDCELSVKQAELLCDACANDYSRVLLELDKIKRYAEVKNISYDDAFIQLSLSGNIYNSPYDAIFDFADAVLSRNNKLTFRLLRECKDVGENTLTMLSVLYTQFKQTLQVQSYAGNSIEKATGLTKWQIKKAQEHANRYSNGEIVSALHLLFRLTQDIKVGRISDTVAVEYALVNIL